MGSESVTRWAIAVRVLGVLSAVLLTIVILEGRTLRRARAELQELRTEREQAKTSMASSWAHQSVDELRQTVHWLDEFYADPERGFGRSGGLCAGGRVDAPAIATSASGFLSARASGASVSASIATVKTGILRTDAYRAVHPDLALPAGK